MWNAIQDELRETIRIHSKRIRLYSGDLDLFTWPNYYSLGIESETYGGRIANKIPECHTLETEFKHESFEYPLLIDIPLKKAPALFTAPPLVVVPPLRQMDPWQIHASELLPKDIPVSTQPVEKISVVSKLVSPAELLIKLTQKIQRLSLQSFKKPNIFRQKFLKNMQVQKHTSPKPFPILRTAIPGHRFSRAHRELFRTRLGEKAGIPMEDVQIVSVFDRVYLGLYQSISQTDDGSLMCIPKATGTSGIGNKSQESTYLIIGKSFSQPGRTFQAIIPTSEVENVSATS